MQTIARDNTGRLIFATQAKKGKEYFCLHCQKEVRRRSSLLRKPHFYHLATGDHCSKNPRSILHRKIQLLIQRQFPEGALTLELPFPALSRIADLAWPEKQLIFEVQCSPISAWEVGRRLEDYSRAGYQVIWLLHDAYFYRKRVREAEHLLRLHPHAFITSQGRCFVDHSPIDRGYRRTPSPTHISLYPFHLSHFLPPPSTPHLLPPSWIRELYYRCLIKWIR